MPSTPFAFRQWLARAVCVAVLLACAQRAPETALRQTISDLRDAIEARDASTIEEHLAEDFIGPDGLDREAAKRLAIGVFLRNRDIVATFGPLDLQLRGTGHATVRFTAAVAGGTGGLLPESGQVHDVQTGWRFEDGRWLLTSAQWQRKL